MPFHDHRRMGHRGRDTSSTRLRLELDEATARAEKAEAAITRVRALADFYADPKERGKLGVPHTLIAYSIRAALDEPKEPRT